jgi:tetratricopeptide (TPR) repeat protein
MLTSGWWNGDMSKSRRNRAKSILHGSSVDNTSPNNVRYSLMIDKKTQFFRIVVLLVIPILFSCEHSRETEKMPYDAATYFNMGTVQLEKGQNEQAIAFFKKRLSLNPKYVDAYYNRGSRIGVRV